MREGPLSGATAALIILAAAFLLTLPAVLSGPMTHDSFWIDWVWADQFTAELARGNLYPRWLPKSHGGLGSPVFYYYPPLGFYLAGLFGLAGLSTYASLIAAFGAALAASGLAMHAFLRERQVRQPLVGALLYMAGPYHLLDFYGRGALAEFVAIAFLPLVALGLSYARRGRFALLAVSYAGLILSHLPLALLASLFLIVPWCVLCGWQASLRVAAPLAAGIALSAIYLAPALALDSFRDSASLWNQPGYNPVDWSFLYWSKAGPLPNARYIVAAVLLSLLPAVVILLRERQHRWAVYAAACLILAAGLIPFVWSLPLLRNVQFPFRIVPLAEFALAAGLANIAWRKTAFWLAIAPALSVSSILMVVHPPPHADLLVLARDHPDVPENLPPGDREYSWPSRWALEIAGLHGSPRANGEMTIEPLFYFPAWEVRCNGRVVVTAPHPETQLLTYRGSGCDIRRTLTTSEQVGAALSFAGLLMLLALVGWGRSRPVGAPVNDPLLI